MVERGAILYFNIVVIFYCLFFFCGLLVLVICEMPKFYFYYGDSEVREELEYDGSDITVGEVKNSLMLQKNVDPNIHVLIVKNSRNTKGEPICN